MNDPMPPSPGLSSASGKPVAVKFDSGVLALRERPRLHPRRRAGASRISRPARRRDSKPRREGGALRMAATFGAFPFLIKLHRDGGY
jgi:hypothetical protein